MSPYVYLLNAWSIRMIYFDLTQQVIKIPQLKRRCSTGGLSGVSLLSSCSLAHRFKPSKFVVIAQLQLNPVRSKQAMNQTGQGMLLFML